MAYHKHIEGAIGYCNRETACAKARKVCDPLGVTWIIASNAKNQHVPVALLNAQNEYMALQLADAGMYVWR